MSAVRMQAQTIASLIVDALEADKPHGYDMEAGMFGPGMTALLDRLGELTLKAYASEAPIPMILFCPKCQTQHIDSEEEFKPSGVCECSFSQDQCEVCDSNQQAFQERWTNPPHRSHLCSVCGTVWRPADVPTVGVESIETKGKDDNWTPADANNAAVAAIKFALDNEFDEGVTFLRCWNEGNFAACREEWPEAPDACYIGADLFFKSTEPK